LCTVLVVSRHVTASIQFSVATVRRMKPACQVRAQEIGDELVRQSADATWGRENIKH
jgi:hypothetical protein